MAVNKVDLYVSQILEDLNNGLTWLKRDDIGYGNIQEKYNAKDQQITMIRKHPKLKDAETNITVFNIIDDTNEPATSVPANGSENEGHVASISEPNQITSAVSKTNIEERNRTNEAALVAADADDLSAFVNL
jgi:hypothetical protein